MTEGLQKDSNSIESKINCENVDYANVEANFFTYIQQTKNFVGHLYEIDYDKASVMVNDYHKICVGGIPHGCFLIAIDNGLQNETEQSEMLQNTSLQNEIKQNNTLQNEILQNKNTQNKTTTQNEKPQNITISSKNLNIPNTDSMPITHNTHDKNHTDSTNNTHSKNTKTNQNTQSNTKKGILLRVIGSVEIPQSRIITESITDSCIAQKNLSARLSPDSYTKHFYQFGGLYCRILGTFYYDKNRILNFGSDIDNFLGPHNYRVYKPRSKALWLIINQNLKDSKITKEIGILRYSSSNTFKNTQDYAPKVLLKTSDILAKRCAFFGMTRSGKSNTIKIIIHAIESLSQNLNQKIGQIIFDINGEYTFSNTQDNGSIYGALAKVARFSTNHCKVEESSDVKAIHYNFYNDDTLEESFEMLCSELLSSQGSNYLYEFANLKFDDFSDEATAIATDIKRAIYKCILYKAGFEPPNDYEISFVPFHSTEGEQHTLESALNHFIANRQDYAQSGYHILINMLDPANSKGVMSGYKALIQFKDLHSPQGDSDYKKIIDSNLRDGKSVFIDLSTISSKTQQNYINHLCTYIFLNSLQEFTEGKTPSFIQMYFEEAHIIFTSNDLDNIYNRLAKEGAKLNIGISYSTQEVSSIPPSILKNTQNWFISHLNNSDEIRVLEKYYDFKDFSQSIIRNSDVGFARIKTFSNNFIIPAQINEFRI